MPVYTVIEGLLAPVSWDVDYTAIGQVSLGNNNIISEICGYDISTIVSTRRLEWAICYSQH